VGDGLAVEAHEVHAPKAPQDFGVRLVDYAGGGLDRLAFPRPQRGAQDVALGLGVGAVGRGPKIEHALAVRDDHGRIHTVERGARHGAQHGHRHPHPLPPIRPALYE
jgi:hypothetical protein